MTRTLLRNCVGCGRSVRGKPRCTDCERDYQRAKRARRPDLYADAQERERRRRVVADHRAIVGDWCPGWERQPAHQSADLTADHVREVAAGGKPDGKLVVRCRSCNAARSAHLARRALAKVGLQMAGAAQLNDAQRSDQRVSPMRTAPPTPRPPKFAREASSADSGACDDGPAVA